jgi:hypothetical protein
MFLILTINQDFNLFLLTLQKFVLNKVHSIAQVRLGIENSAAFLPTRSPGSKSTLRKISGELKLGGITASSISPSPLFFLPYCTFKMPVFVRSVAPFLRTARSALHQGHSVSPLQHLRSRNGASLLNGARTYAAVFERTKPHVNIGV